MSRFTLHDWFYIAGIIAIWIGAAYLLTGGFHF